MKLTKEQLYKILEEDYAKYEKSVNTESVQEIIKLGEYLKQNPLLDLNTYAEGLKAQITLMNNAREQLEFLKQLDAKDTYIVDFLHTECKNIFSFLEGVPLEKVPDYLGVIAKLIINLKDAQPKVLPAGDLMLFLQEQLMNGDHHD